MNSYCDAKTKLKVASSTGLFWYLSESLKRKQIIKYNIKIGISNNSIYVLTLVCPRLAVFVSSLFLTDNDV